MENFNLLVIILLVVFPIWALHIAFCIGFVSIWFKVKRLENMETSLANMEEYLHKLSITLNQHTQSTPIISIGTSNDSEDFMEMAKDAGVDINNQEELRRFFDGLNKDDEEDDKPWEKNK